MCAKNAHFSYCHSPNLAPTLRQVQTDPNKPNQRNAMETKLEETLMTLMTICGGLIAALIFVVPYVMLWKLANAQ